MDRTKTGQVDLDHLSSFHHNICQVGVTNMVLVPHLGKFHYQVMQS